MADLVSCYPPAPLKGGLFSFFKISFYMFADKPPFRCVGGQKIRKKNLQTPLLLPEIFVLPPQSPYVPNL
jgi:hypothetical protein